MFNTFGDLIGGGINAVTTLAQSLQRGISDFGGSLPTPQKTQTVSQITQSANTLGTTYRATSPDAPSILETLNMYAQGWINSPYELQYAVEPKITESQELAAAISSTSQKKPLTGTLSDILAAARTGLQTAGEIKTVVNEYKQIFDAITHETIKGTPRAGTPEGRNEANVETSPTTGTSILNLGKAYGEAFISQLKGLFNLGYESSQGSQPAFAIQHEIEPSPKLTTGMIIIVALLIGIMIIGVRRK